MCTCGHSEKDHAPCGKCLVEGCECEVFEKQKVRSRRPERSIWWLPRPSKTGPAMMFREVDMRIWLEKAQAETKGEC